MNSKLLALKQAFAFFIDLMLVSLPLIIAPSVEIFPLFALLWLLYIPLSEYYFNRTLGMKIVGTYIYASLEDKSSIAFTTALRRHIARIGFLWGVVGWFLMFLGKPYKTDYLISDGTNYSVEVEDRGLVELHEKNPYKVIFIALVLMTLFSIFSHFKLF